MQQNGDHVSPWKYHDFDSHIFWATHALVRRELKFAEESYWKGEITQAEFLAKAQALEASNWQAKRCRLIFGDCG